MFTIDYIFCSDIKNITAWNPESEEDVYFILEIELRWNDDLDTTIFELLVATKESLSKRGSISKKYSKYKYTMIVFDYSWDKVYSYLVGILKKCNIQGDKDKSIELLRKYLLWEYEGCK